MQLGLGSQGRAAPVNVVVDPTLESLFRREGACTNREKRWFYYGRDIPSGEVIDAPWSNSPTKRGGFGSGSNNEYYLSPSCR